jgi:hypothetical protein
MNGAFELNEALQLVQGQHIAENKLPCSAAT